MAHIDTHRHKMSSNIEVKRICQHCNREFFARTTVTKYCSDKCGKRAYKARIKAEKIQKSNIETQRIKNQPIEVLKAKEYLNIREVCELVGISKRTVYRLIEKGDLDKIKIGSRTIIKRTALNSFIDNTNSEIVIPKKQELNEWVRTGLFDIADSYTLKEAQEKYGVSERVLYDLIKREHIPKVQKGWYVYIQKSILDKYFKLNTKA